MSDGGTEWELQQAENAISAAGTDMAALAKAQRRHADAIRNMMQGTLVPMFVQLVERALDTKLAPLVSSQKETQDGVAALGGRFQVLTDAVAKIERDMRALDKRHGAQIKALAEDIAAIKEVIAARPAERAKDQKRLEERLARMEQRLAALEAHHAE